MAMVGSRLAVLGLAAVLCIVGVRESSAQVEVWDGGRRFELATAPFNDEPIGIAATEEHVYVGAAHRMSQTEWRFVLARYTLQGDLDHYQYWPDPDEAIGVCRPHAMALVHIKDQMFRIFLVGEVPSKQGTADAAVVAFSSDDDLGVHWSWVYTPDSYDGYRDERAILVQSVPLSPDGNAIVVGMQSTRLDAGGNHRTRFMHTALSATASFGRPLFSPVRFEGVENWQDDLVGMTLAGVAPDNIYIVLVGTSFEDFSDDTHITTVGFEWGSKSPMEGFPQHILADEDATYTAAGTTGIGPIYVAGTLWPRPGNPLDWARYLLVSYSRSPWPAWSEQWREWFGEHERQSVASDVLTVIGVAQSGNIIHVTGTAADGPFGTRALTLQYLDQGTHASLQWIGYWPADTNVEGPDGMGFRLTFGAPGMGLCAPMYNITDAVYVAAAGRLDSTSPYALGTVRYNIDPLGGGPYGKLPDWTAYRPGGIGDDFPTAISNRIYNFGPPSNCTEHRYIFITGTSPSEGGNETVLSTVIDDDWNP
jgi:hypothetical protein